MQFTFSRFVFYPQVAMIGSSAMTINGLDEAIDQMGASEPAEEQHTPLNNLTSRVLNGGNGDDIAEFSGRQCYRSWDRGRSSAEYHENIRSMGHGSIYEHASINFQITGVSRTLTHELIRHRVGTAYSQESQRYVDAKDIRFIVPTLLSGAIYRQMGERWPTGWDDLRDNVSMETFDVFNVFAAHCERSLTDYIDLQPMLAEMAKDVEREFLKGDVKAAVSAKKRANEAAREVLPNAAETRLVFTCNLRELRHVMLLRGDEPADLQIRRLACLMFYHARNYAPHFFSDLCIQIGTDGLPLVNTSESKRV